VLRKLLAVGVVALIVVLAGLNLFQWRLRERRGPVQDLPGIEGAAAPQEPSPPLPPGTRGFSPALPPGTEGAARSAVLLIGDGMGIAHVTAAALRAGDGDRLAMEGMPVTGLVRTESASNIVTDSAAAATALSTGVRTRNGALGVDPEGRSLGHLLEAAAAAGKAVGILTTDRLTGATPAGFCVHVASRG
jgi:hypothetical protein